MTMVEIIAIIVTVILCVLCVLCIVALLGSKRQAKDSARAMKDIERELGSFGDSIKEKTDQLIDNLEKQQAYEVHEKRLEVLEEEIRSLSRYQEEMAEASARLMAAEAEAKAARPAPEIKEDIEQIEELDDEIELEDLFNELNSQTVAAATEVPAEPEEPFVQTPDPQPPRQTQTQSETRHHTGYNVGRSGKKYTAEELNMLIRE